MNKKLIRLTESDLHRIVKESINNVLTEVNCSNNLTKLLVALFIAIFDDMRGGNVHISKRIDLYDVINNIKLTTDNEELINTMENIYMRLDKKTQRFDDESVGIEFFRKLIQIHKSL